MTWSNMQAEPLLEHIDWFFTSVAWSPKYPNTLAPAFARITSDHIPCKVQIGTYIPKANIFRCENFLFHHPTFMVTVFEAWGQNVRAENKAKVISSKFKLLRRTLKHRARNLSYLLKLIANCNLVIAFLDSLEKHRNLYTHESIFTLIVKNHLQRLLHLQNEYWRQRFTQRFIQLGDENTKLFHSMTTERYRKNTISQILSPEGRMVFDHHEKSALFL